jgi:hypothetical protein
VLNLPNNWNKSIALERHFLLTFCCCWQKVSRIEGILCEKHHADAVRDDVSEANGFKHKKGEPKLTFPNSNKIQPLANLLQSTHIRLQNSRYSDRPISLLIIL